MKHRCACPGVRFVCSTKWCDVSRHLSLLPLTFLMSPPSPPPPPLHFSSPISSSPCSSLYEQNTLFCPPIRTPWLAEQEDHPRLVPSVWSDRMTGFTQGAHPTSLSRSSGCPTCSSPTNPSPSPPPPHSPSTCPTVVSTTTGFQG